MATPSAAYSLKRYVYGHSGPVCRLREDNGSTLQDFQIVGGQLVTNDVNQDSVATWLANNSAANAYAETWYDHSGNARNAVQTTTSEQPLFDAVGVNGGPAFKGDGSSAHLQIPDGTLSLRDCTSVVSVKLGTNNQYGMYLTAQGGSADYRLGRKGGSYHWKVAGSTKDADDSYWAKPDQKRILSLRHNFDNTYQAWVDGNPAASGSVSSGANVVNMAFLSRRDGVNAAAGWINEAHIFDSAVTDGELTALHDELILTYGIAPSVQTRRGWVDDTPVGRPDGFDAVDITGSGLKDLLNCEETGAVDWYEQTAAHTWTKRTILASTVSGAANEGACWIFPDGSTPCAVIADQGNGEIRLYEPDTPGDLQNTTWTEGVLITGRGNLQDVIALDLGSTGSDKIVYSWEGSNAGNGGIHSLEYSGTGTLSDSANWTDRAHVFHSGAWALADEMRPLGSSGRDCILYTARDKQAYHLCGVYFIEEPVGGWSGTWDRTTIIDDTVRRDWLRVDFGDYAGDTTHGKDVIANTLAGRVSIFAHDGSWAETVIAASDQAGAQYNVRQAHWRTNNRSAVVSFGSAYVQVFQFAKAEGWESTARNAFVAKNDDRVALLDPEGDGVFDYYSGDSNRREVLQVIIDGAPPAPLPPSGLDLQYNFDDKSGTQVTDSGSNSRHGTLVGDDGTNFWQP